MGMEHEFRHPARVVEISRDEAKEEDLEKMGSEEVKTVAAEFMRRTQRGAGADPRSH